MISFLEKGFSNAILSCFFFGAYQRGDPCFLASHFLRFFLRNHRGYFGRPVEKGTKGILGFRIALLDRHGLFDLIKYNKPSYVCYINCICLYVFSVYIYIYWFKYNHILRPYITRIQWTKYINNKARIVLPEGQTHKKDKSSFGSFRKHPALPIWKWIVIIVTSQYSTLAHCSLPKGTFWAGLKEKMEITHVLQAHVKCEICICI